MAKRYSHTTVNLVRVILSGMYTQAVRNRMALRNPVKNTYYQEEKAEEEDPCDDNGRTKPVYEIFEEQPIL